MTATVIPFSALRDRSERAFYQRLEARRARIAVLMRRLTDARDRAPIPERPCDSEASE